MFGGKKVSYFCFKQLPLNVKQKIWVSVPFNCLYHSMYLVDKPLDFHDMPFLVLASFFKA